MKPKLVIKFSITIRNSGQMYLQCGTYYPVEQLQKNMNAYKASAYEEERNR